ncbi:MAG: hypothetical protein ACI90V_009488, partial [Bacillariaceae sp.]
QFISINRMGVSSLLSDLITVDFRTAVVVVILTTTFLSNLSKVPYLSSILRWSVSNIRLQLLLLIRKGKNNNNAITTSDNNNDNNNDDDDSCIAKVSGIYIHPVKSMRSISLLESTINLQSRCLTDDRRFMVVYESPLPAYKKKWELDDATHRFLTQRQCPSLATISATIETTTTTTKATATKDDDDGNFLILEKQSFPVKSGSGDSGDVTMTRIRIPLGNNNNNNNKNQKQKQTYLAGLWDNVVVVEDLGDDAAAFIQRIVDDDDEFSSTDRKIVVRLVSQPTTSATSTSTHNRPKPPVIGRDDRNYIPDYAKTWNGSALGKPSLTDGFPILIASEASLDELNKKLIASGKDIIPMSRFRPNIVIQGKSSLQPFEEDKWKIILIGDIVFAIVKACPRCKQSCTDQITGKVSPEPVETMKSFRRGTLSSSSSSSDDGGAVFFAQNAIPIGRIEGRSIKVGDTVTVLERGDPVYID